MKYKSIDAELLALLMKNHKLIANLRKRRFTATAIAKAVLAAEDSKR